MAHIGQSRPDPGLDLQVKVLKTYYFVPSPLGRLELKSCSTRARDETRFRTGFRREVSRSKTSCARSTSEKMFCFSKTFSIGQSRLDKAVKARSRMEARSIYA